MKNPAEIQELIKKCGDNYIRLLQKIGVLYIRPKRGVDLIGPIVGRQSTYANPLAGGEPLHHVSQNYYNGKVLLLYPMVIKHLAQAILAQMEKQSVSRGAEYQGVGPGGEMLAHYLQLQTKKRLKVPGFINRENGHNRLVLVQDILDPIPLSKAIEETKLGGKRISLICGIINPGQCFDGHVHASQGPILLITLMKELLLKYQQDHPLVKEDVENGNIVWDPKNDWGKLAKVIEESDMESEREREILVV